MKMIWWIVYEFIIMFHSVCASSNYDVDFKTYLVRLILKQYSILS